jgi:putative hydrolase of the HAD superfamily
VSDDAAIGVTFDVGQTLLELDLSMLARRLAERGHEVPRVRLEVALGPAWRAYDDHVGQGGVGHPWKVLLAHLLEGAGVSAEATPALVDWLFVEQQTQNLWRHAVPGMIELARELCNAGVPIAILSNSEGRLEELMTELGHAHLFRAIVDSGRLGIEKPDPRIFAWTAGRLALPLDRVVHIGDSHSADVAGALGAGMRAIWFRGTADAPHRKLADVAPLDEERARVCSDAAEVRATLRDFGVRVG